jgi:hypothetical protein
MHGDGQRAKSERNFLEIAVVGSDRRVDGDCWQEGSGGQRIQEGFASNIIYHINFIDEKRNIEEECMACLWTDKYINNFAFRSHFNRCTTCSVTETYFFTIT